MNEQQEITSTISDMTAGQMLKNARTTGRRKREISTIAKLLCIREEFLTALEEENYRFIPEDVYILGFARSYAVELGLDPDEVISKLKKELGIIEEKVEEDEEMRKREENMESWLFFERGKLPYFVLPPSKKNGQFWSFFCSKLWAVI